MINSRLKPYYRVGGLRVFGAPLYLHLSVIIVAALFGLLAFNSPVVGAIAVASYLSIILVHELGHAFFAHRLGLAVYSIKIGWFHGSCEFEEPGDERCRILVAWGGVVAQFVVACIVFLVAAFLPDGNLGYLGPVVIFLGYVNLMVAAVNLAPSPGFDGAVAWRIVPYLYRNRRARRKPQKARDKARKRWGVRD